MVIDVSTKDGRIPTDLPAILKNFTKAAIRTQPKDLLSWSYAYFKALCDGEAPPVKDHLEFPLPDTTSGITPGIMRVYNNKLSPMDKIAKPVLMDMCLAFGIDEGDVEKSWDLAKEQGADVKFWIDVLVELLKHISKDILQQLRALMQIVSEDMMTKKVGIDEFIKYFDRIHPEEENEELHKETVEYFQDLATYQNGFINPSDLNRPTCPLATTTS